MDARTAISDAAKEEHLDLLGVTHVEILDSTPDGGFYAQWLAKGYAGEMQYLKGERAARRLGTDALLPGARSVICVGMNYNTAHPRSTECADASRGWISRYAWGDDYHKVLRDKLDRMLQAMRARIADAFEARPFVDTAPVLERAFARQAGVGWMGKNTCIIHQRLGSWLFLGEILTTLEIPPDFPAPDRCGTCTRCIDACPTAALVEPRVLDATRCISYWTIESKTEAFPADAAAGVGRHVFGCDICQDVCPWNRRAPVTAAPELQPRAGLVNPELEDLARLTEEEFHALFNGGPLQRLGYRRFIRNVQAALANVDANAPRDAEKLPTR